MTNLAVYAGYNTLNENTAYQLSVITAVQVVSGKGTYLMNAQVACSICRWLIMQTALL